MKLSFLQRLCQLPRTATEQQITQALERMATRANVAPGQMYATPQLAGASATDISRDSLDWVVRSIRPGFWIVYTRGKDGTFKPWGSKVRTWIPCRRSWPRKTWKRQARRQTSGSGKSKRWLMSRWTAGTVTSWRGASSKRQGRICSPGWLTRRRHRKPRTRRARNDPAQGRDRSRSSIPKLTEKPINTRYQ